MESHAVPPTALQTAAHPTPRRPYAPPTATFVPLKLEERLLACSKEYLVLCFNAPSAIS
jgi:hypothetical protein